MAVKPARITWLIDLDNTLHNASHAIFPAMHDKMNAYIAKVLGDGDQPASAEVVDAARRRYWKRYGATLLGLMQHHQVRADDFLRFTHDFEGLADMLRYEPGLNSLLRRLPGDKVLFTNAPRHYAQQVIRHIGLHQSFDHHVAIEAMQVHRRLRPKPSRWLLRKLLARRGLTAQRCVLVEDSLDNLRSAKQMGMKTVWVTQYGKTAASAGQRFSRAAYVDVRVRSIRNLPAHFQKLSCKPAKH